MTFHFTFPHSSPLKFSFISGDVFSVYFVFLFKLNGEEILTNLSMAGWHFPGSFRQRGHGRLPCNIFYACLNGRSL